MRLGVQSIMRKTGDEEACFRALEGGNDCQKTEIEGAGVGKRIRRRRKKIRG